MTPWRLKIFSKWPDGPKYVSWDGLHQTTSFEGSQHMITVFPGWLANTVTQFPSNFDRNQRSQKTANGLKWRTWKPTHLRVIESEKLKFCFEKIISFQTKTQPFSLKIHGNIFLVNVVATKNSTNTSSPCNCNAPSVATCWLAHRLFSTGIYEFTWRGWLYLFKKFLHTGIPGLGWKYSYHMKGHDRWYDPGYYDKFDLLLKFHCKKIITVI